MDRNKLVEMLTLQDNFNKKVNPDWVNAKYRWSDAIMVESVEAFEHYNSWKWWKKQNPDVEQTVMELVDIWHFIMSDMMETFNLAYRERPYIETTADAILARYEEIKDNPVYGDVNTINSYFRDMTGRAANQESTLTLFFYLLSEFNVTPDELYKLYVAKNALNHFRQSHGYKDGTYIKTWNGEEDNVHLMRAVDILSTKVGVGSLFESVLKELELIYATVK